MSMRHSDPQNVLTPAVYARLYRLRAKILAQWLGHVPDEALCVLVSTRAAVPVTTFARCTPSPAGAQIPVVARMYRVRRPVLQHFLRHLLGDPVYHQCVASKHKAFAGVHRDISGLSRPRARIPMERFITHTAPRLTRTLRRKEDFSQAELQAVYARLCQRLNAARPMVPRPIDDFFIPED